LRDAVVKYVKILLFEVQDQLAFGVMHSDRCVHQRDLDANCAFGSLLHSGAGLGSDRSLRTLGAHGRGGKCRPRSECSKTGCQNSSHSHVSSLLLLQSTTLEAETS